MALCWLQLKAQVLARRNAASNALEGLTSKIKVLVNLVLVKNGCPPECRLPQMSPSGLAETFAICIYERLPCNQILRLAVSKRSQSEHVRIFLTWWDVRACAKGNGCRRSVQRVIEKAMRKYWRLRAVRSVAEKFTVTIQSHNITGGSFLGLCRLSYPAKQT